jgi:hypothetical protein
VVEAMGRQRGSWAEARGRPSSSFSFRLRCHRESGIAADISAVEAERSRPRAEGQFPTAIGATGRLVGVDLPMQCWTVLAIV